MLIPLLGIPNIMQTIPFSPTQDNITYFAIWTYCASFTYMYQGFMIGKEFYFLDFLLLKFGVLNAKMSILARAARK